MNRKPYYLVVAADLERDSWPHQHADVFTSIRDARRAAREYGGETDLAFNIYKVERLYA